MLTLSKTERNSEIREESRAGEEGRAALEVRSFPQEAEGIQSLRQRERPTRPGWPWGIGGGGGNRTRVRELSALGSTCLSASIHLTHGYPTGRENHGRSRLGFNGSAPGALHRDPVRVDAPNLNAQARLQWDGTLLGFRQRVRSCRRWQLYFADGFTRKSASSACTSGFATHVETRSPPISHILTPAGAGSSTRMVGAGGADGKGDGAQRLPDFRIRCFSRCQSRSFRVARLSWAFLPLARPISTLTRPRFQ